MWQNLCNQCDELKNMTVSQVANAKAKCRGMVLKHYVQSRKLIKDQLNTCLHNKKTLKDQDEEFTDYVLVLERDKMRANKQKLKAQRASRQMESAGGQVS